MVAVEFDATTALLVVDMQEDFASPTGSLFVPDAEHMLSTVNETTVRAREAGALIVYTQDWHPADTPHFKKDGGIWPVHCVGGEAGAEFVTGLEREERDPVIRKGLGGEDGYSAFSVRDPSTGKTSETELATLLHQHGIQRVVVVGLATDYCVGQTALDARRLGFDTTVIEKGVRAVNLHPSDGQRAFDAMRAAGVHVV